MEYIKLYEEFEPVKEKTFSYWLENNSLHTGKSGWVNIKEINCGDMSLTSLEGVDKLKKLEDLLCYRNELYSLKGVENLKNLKLLDCGRNHLQNLAEIENLIKLKILNFSDNRIENIEELKNLINLTYIDCSHNDLCDLEFGGEYSMDVLELGIDETDLIKFKNLKELYCYENKFSDRYMRHIKEYCRRKNIKLN